MQIQNLQSIEALNNNVVGLLVEPMESILVTPGTVDVHLRWTEVVSTGPGAVDLNGKPAKLAIEPGNYGYVMAHGIEPIPTEGQFKGRLIAASYYDVMYKMIQSPDDAVPLGNLIEIERIEGSDHSSILHVPEALRTLPNLGIVKAIGTGWTDCYGNPLKIDLEVGDTVGYIPSRVMVVDFKSLGHDVKKYCVSYGDVLFKIRKS